MIDLSEPIQASYNGAQHRYFNHLAGRGITLIYMQQQYKATECSHVKFVPHATTITFD